MKAATCKQCGKEAMAVVDYVEAEEALFAISEGLAGSTALECCYCGQQRRSRDDDEIRAAYHYGDEARRIFSRIISEERAKVARLQEGRW